MTPEHDVAVSLKIPADLVTQVDARIRKLDLNRSQYFRRLARADLASESAARKQSAAKAPAMEAA